MTNRQQQASVEGFHLVYIEGRAQQAHDALYAASTSNNRLLHLMSKSQSDVLPLVAALRGVLRVLDDSGETASAAALRKALRRGLTGGE